MSTAAQAAPDYFVIGKRILVGDALGQGILTLIIPLHDRPR
jgi:hypothetical protein